ncbi:MAG: Glyoxalase/bleomycin resistance protein/dioxygenase [Proteobacteria bacterium]|nr:Glyoxalase/bleomycin resistance protein/dioxygenase [Pseudomonadota bacterium]
MSRIVHLALKVDDLEKTTEFYQKVFGFAEVETKKTRDHTSRHLTDGDLDFTLIKYDAGTQSAE